MAHNKVSYYCEETIDHPLYLPGAINARCSLTIPLLWHDQVIGTCNVESKTPGVFTERDLYFLQIFTRDVASALHTFNLLSHEKELAVLSSIEAVFGSVSSPIDQILQNASVLLDECVGQTEASRLLRKILENSRVIKDHINMVRRKMIQGTTNYDQNIQERPLLNRRRILVVDQDAEVLRNAHKILEKYNAIVETAPNALIALKMIRVEPYDAILCEIKPEGGMSGYQFMLRLFDLYPQKSVVPLLLMTGYGYDPGHTIISARQKGLLGVLFKPFIPKQLLSMLENVVNVCSARDANGNLILPEDPAALTDDPTGAVRTAPTGFASASEELRLGKKGGFCEKHSANRFNVWADQIPDTSQNPSAPNEDGQDRPELDAT